MFRYYAGKVDTSLCRNLPTGFYVVFPPLKPKTGNLCFGLNIERTRFKKNSADNAKVCCSLSAQAHCHKYLCRAHCQHHHHSVALVLIKPSLSSSLKIPKCYDLDAWRNVRHWTQSTRGCQVQLPSVPTVSTDCWQRNFSATQIVAQAPEEDVVRRKTQLKDGYWTPSYLL